MKSKYIPLILLSVIIVAVAILFVAEPLGFEFSLNVKKYHSLSADGKDFSFYGSFGKVGKVTVRENGKKLASLKIDADADVFDGDICAVELCDVDQNEKKDLLILTSLDEDGDSHRALFLAKGDGYSLAKNVDVVNFTSDGGKLISEEQSFVYLAETVVEYTVPYEKSVSITTYEYYEGTVIPADMTVVSYYSESDIYCVGIWQYDVALEELVCISEDWLLPSEYSRIYEQLDEIFSVELP